MYVKNGYPGQNRMEQLSYGSIYEGLLSAITDRYDKYPINAVPDIINDVFSAILHDHPEIFWFEGKWRLGRDKEEENCCFPVYNMDADGIAAAKQKICSILPDLDDMLKGLTPYEIAKTIYQWTVSNTEYGMEQSDGQNIYDALIKRKAVCKGIAKAYQFLLSRYGIFSSIVIGTLDGKSRHIWNVIRLEDKYYNVDICMEYKQLEHMFCHNERSRLKGFLLSDRQLARTHAWIRNYPYRIKCDNEVDDNEYI